MRSVFVHRAVGLFALLVLNSICAPQVFAQKLGDLYISTKTGFDLTTGMRVDVANLWKIPEGPGGIGTYGTPALVFPGTVPQPPPMLPLEIFRNAESLGFDPASREFVLVDDITSGVPVNIVRISFDLKKATKVNLTAGPGVSPADLVLCIGGDGSAIDTTRKTAGRSDILVASRDCEKVFRINGAGLVSVAADPRTSGLYGPMDTIGTEEIVVDPAGRMFVGVVGRILEFAPNGTFLLDIPIPGGFNPFCMAYDENDTIPDYEIVAASFFGSIFLIDLDGASPTIVPVMIDFMPIPFFIPSCDNLCISPAGQIIYPDVINGIVYVIDPVPVGGFVPAHLIATIPLASGCTFVSAGPAGMGNLFPVGIDDDMLASVRPGDLVRFHDSDKVTDANGNSIFGGNRAWLNFNFIYNAQDPSSRTVAKNHSNPELIGWIINDFAGPVFAGTIGNLDGDFINGDPGTRGSSFDAAMARIGDVIKLPVYDTIYTRRFFEANPSMFPVPAIGFAGGGAGGTYYHVIGFASFRVTFVQSTGNDKFIEGFFQ